MNEFGSVKILEYNKILEVLPADETYTMFTHSNIIPESRACYVQQVAAPPTP